MQLGSDRRREQVSIPTIRDRHLISDEELTMPRQKSQQETLLEEIRSRPRVSIQTRPNLG